MTEADVRERVIRLEKLLQDVEGNLDAEEVVGALVEVYGEALRRLVNGADPKTDELVSHLLLMHDIEPPTFTQITPLRRASMAS